MSPPSSLFSLFQKKSPRAGFSRSSTRLTIGTPAQLRLAGKIEVASRAVILEDISIGGARLHTTRQLKVGEVVDLLLSLGAKKQLELRGVIKYASDQAIGFQSCYGVRFIALTEEKRERLSQFIDGSACRVGRR